MTREEYEALIERMLSMQLREAEQLADVDENGLETIDLTDDIGATSSRRKHEDAASSKNAAMTQDDDSDEAPAILFQKTKSNNFFAVDDSQDQIQPFEEDADTDAAIL